MKYSIYPIAIEDREPIIDILNYYIENSFAAYPETKHSYQAFDKFIQVSEGYPTAALKLPNGKTVGFGMLRSYHHLPVFSYAAEFTVFFDPDHTRMGLGSTLLEYLLKEGMEKGITTILANISSLNMASIKFHTKNGFKECGRFKGIGIKNGQIFDMVWMQKML